MFKNKASMQGRELCLKEIMHKKMSNLLQQLRVSSYWSFDRLSGGESSRAFCDLKKYCDDCCNYESLISYQKKILNKILKHAVLSTNYYSKHKDYYSKHKDPFEVLSCFPVVNKVTIRNQQNDFISSMYDKKKLFKMSTSGSTGTPFTVFQNKEKKKRVNTELIYYSSRVGYNLGSKLIFLRALTEKTRKSSVLMFLQNETLIDISKLNEKRISIILEKIKKATYANGAILLSNASTLDVFKEYFINNNIFKLEHIKIKGIISNGEVLYDNTRVKISEVFNAPCISRYSNQENGVLGQDIPDMHNIFLINEAHYIFEVLKLDCDEPAESGESGRIAITDLYNYAMPIVRYDTGDIGVINHVNINSVVRRAITKFEGRKVDLVYDSEGSKLSPHIITNSMWPFTEIKQFQFIQLGHTEYEIRINADNSFSRENQLYKVFMDLLGEKAHINIVRVNEIPILLSGKRRSVVNHMK